MKDYVILDADNVVLASSSTKTGAERQMTKLRNQRIKAGEMGFLRVRYLGFGKELSL